MSGWQVGKLKLAVLSNSLHLMEEELLKSTPEPATSSPADLPLKIRAVALSAWVLSAAFWAWMLRFIAHDKGQSLGWIAALVLSAFGLGVFQFLRSHVAPRWPRQLKAPEITVVLAALIFATILSMVFGALLDLLPYLPSGVHVVAQQVFVVAFIGLVPPMRARTRR